MAWRSRDGSAANFDIYTGANRRLRAVAGESRAANDHSTHVARVVVLRVAASSEMPSIRRSRRWRGAAIYATLRHRRDAGLACVPLGLESLGLALPAVALATLGTSYVMVCVEIKLHAPHATDATNTGHGRHRPDRPRARTAVPAAAHELARGGAHARRLRRAMCTLTTVLSRAALPPPPLPRRLDLVHVQARPVGRHHGLAERLAEGRHVAAVL